MNGKRIGKRFLSLLLVLVFMLSGLSAMAEEAENPSKAKWTVLMYLCGSNLESNWACATYDLDQLALAAASEDVNFVVQTGGSREWHTEGIRADKITRFRMDGGERKDVLELPMANMGDPNTLGSFLKWGVETYPAEKTMVVMMDHGGATIGAMRDEMYSSMMSVTELAQGFAQAGITFDIIGFDACLMASMEVAACLAPYARYLVASEEVELSPGWGWQTFSSVLAKNPSIEPLRLAKDICDGYLAVQEANGTQRGSTISVIDLEKIDAVVQAVDNMALAMSECISDTEKLRALTMELAYAKRYLDEDTRDLVSFARCAKVLDEAVTQQVENAVKDCVVYHTNGGDFEYNNGLTIFYGLALSNARYDSYAQCCPSNAYLAFLDAMNYGWRAPAQTYATVARGAEPDFEQYHVTFELADAQKGAIPALHVTGGLNVITSINYQFIRVDEKENRSYLLSTIPNLNVGEDDATFTPYFDGTGATFGGIPCTLTLLEEYPDYAVYEIPVYAEEQVLGVRVAWYPSSVETTDADTEKQEQEAQAETESQAGEATSGWTGAVNALKDGRFVVLGMGDSYHSGSNLPNRNANPLTEAVNMTLIENETDGAGTVALQRLGKEITYQPGKTIVEMQQVPNGTYAIRYIIKDALGRTYQSDMVGVSVKNGKMVN